MLRRSAFQGAGSNGRVSFGLRLWGENLQYAISHTARGPGTETHSTAPSTKNNICVESV